MRRLIVIAVEEGEPLEIDYEPEDKWDLAEARMFLREAVEMLTEQIQEDSE